MSRQSEALSFATQQAMPPKFGGKWKTECLTTRFALPALLYAGYSMKLIYTTLNMSQMRTSSDETNPTHCWVSCEVTEGTFNATEAHNDMVQVKFTRPVILKVS